MSVGRFYFYFFAAYGFDALLFLIGRTAVVKVVRHIVGIGAAAVVVVAAVAFVFVIV